MEEMEESISDSSVDDDTEKYCNPPATAGPRPKVEVTVREEDDGGISALLENIALYRVQVVLDGLDSAELESLKYFHINTSSEEGDLSDSSDDDDIRGNEVAPLIKKEPLIKVEGNAEEDISIKPSCSKDSDFPVSPDRLNRLISLTEELSAKIKSEKKEKYDREMILRNDPYKERSRSKSSNRSSDEERSYSKRSKSGNRSSDEERLYSKRSKSGNRSSDEERLYSKRSGRGKIEESRKHDRSYSRKTRRHKVKQEYSDDSDRDESHFSFRLGRSERKISACVLPQRKHTRFSSPPDRKWSRHSPSPKRSRWHHSSPSSSSSSPERQESHFSMEPRVYSRTEREGSEPPPKHLFGSYHCELCKTTMTSQVTFDSHMAGKKHFKALKAKNAFENVPSTSSSQTTEVQVQSKYPAPLPNVERIKVDEEAKLQPHIEKKVKTPCPGLYNVIEIQGISETHYYCKVCNSPCSSNSIIPHLNGFKHMLRCLEFFSPAAYNRLKYKQKYEIEPEIIGRLEAVKLREGLGRIAVEKEILVGSELSFYERNNDLVEKLGIDSRQIISSGNPAFDLLYAESCVPDTSKGGYHCNICEAHTNSKEMWESHVKGKRHLTNVRKIPTGSAPSKLRSIPMPSLKPFLEELCSDVDVPIVGLNYIRETQNLVTKTRLYQCNLCGACMTDGDIVEHLISQKHRIKYLEEINHSDLAILDSMSLQDHSTCTLVEGLCATIEMEQGRGHPQVFVTKNNLCI